jgi:hypothetical protein
MEQALSEDELSRDVLTEVVDVRADPLVAETSGVVAVPSIEVISLSLQGTPMRRRRFVGAVVGSPQSREALTGAVADAGGDKSGVGGGRSRDYVVPPDDSGRDTASS